LVDMGDTLAVSLNYNLTHPARFGIIENDITSLDPSLLLSVTPDSMPPAAHVHVDIDSGTSTIPVDSIYGIAFTLFYDPSVVDSDSISIDFTGSWLGTAGGDMIAFTKSFPAGGQIDFAMCRNDMTNIFGGFGHLGALDVVIVDNISTVTDSQLRLANVTALTASETFLSLSTQDDTLFVRPFLSSNQGDLLKLISIYPNPASEKIFINGNSVELMNVELFDLQGRKLLESKCSGANAGIDVTDISAGVYHIRCNTSKGLFDQRIEIRSH